MPVNYTNRKGQTYTLYRGQTRSGKPRYYFGRAGQGQGEPVTEIPPGYSIIESVNGVVSLAKDRPSLIQPEEVAAVEAAVQRHATGLPSSKTGSRSTSESDLIMRLWSVNCVYPAC